MQNTNAYTNKQLVFVVLIHQSSHCGGGTNFKTKTKKSKTKTNKEVLSHVHVLILFFYKLFSSTKIFIELYTLDGFKY